MTFKDIEHFAFFQEIGFCDDDDDAFAGFDDLAGERLVELRMWFG